MRAFALLLVTGLLLGGATGCYATRLVSVPMRIVGAAASAVPVVGDRAHRKIDEAAEAVDELVY